MNFKWKLFLSILLTLALSYITETGAIYSETGRLRQSAVGAVPLDPHDGAEVDDANDDVDDDNVDDANDEDVGNLMPDDDDDDDEDEEPFEEVEETGKEEIDATTNYTAAINETAAALKDLKNENLTTLLKKPKKPDESVTNISNTWKNHCHESWNEYPCRLGWRHGCQNELCWSQCIFMLPLKKVGEWCWVQTEKSVNETGTADDSDWKYLTCKTDADCTKQKAYRKKCKGLCTVFGK